MVEYGQEHNDDVDVLAWFDGIGGAGWCGVYDVDLCDLEDGQQEVGGDVFVLRVDARFYHLKNVDALLLTKAVKEIRKDEKATINCSHMK